MMTHTIHVIYISAKLPEGKPNGFRGSLLRTRFLEEWKLERRMHFLALELTPGVSSISTLSRDVWETATRCPAGEGQHYTKSAGFCTTCTTQDCHAGCAILPLFWFFEQPKAHPPPKFSVGGGYSVINYFDIFRELHTLYICGTTIDHNNYRFFTFFYFRCGRISRNPQASGHFLVCARNRIACSDVY